MNIFSHPLDILKDPQVKHYFLGILDSDLSTEEQYQKFLDFFETESRIKNLMLNHADQIMSGDEDQINRVIAQVSQEAGLWNPQDILQQTEDSIKRAIRRLKHSQHRCDGGWGPRPEQSDFWGTVHAVLCLNSARALEDLAFDVDIGEMLKKGMDWLEKDSQYWLTASRPVYHISMAIRCFYRAGRESLPAISECVSKIAGSQNQDGGWDACIWSPWEAKGKRVFSEVGGTSFAVQALAETKDRAHEGVIRKAIGWLVGTQNANGSWNYGSRHPGIDKLGEGESIAKTCEALQGILSGKALDLDWAGYKEQFDKAIAWLQSQEQPIFNSDRKIEGWGWRDYDSTCLTLETLVRMPDAALPLLSSNAQWLIKHQYKQDGDIEDGNWQQGHTSRIALSLIEYYKIIRTNPLFSPERQ